MNLTPSVSRFLRRADTYLNSRRPGRALRPLTACWRSISGHDTLSPELCSRLTRLWAAIPDRKLGRMFKKAASAFFPSDPGCVTRLAQLYLPVCTVPEVIRRLTRSLPGKLEPLASCFRQSGLDCASSGNYRGAECNYRAATLIAEAWNTTSLSPDRGCWAAALYAEDEYAAAAEVYEPCHKTRTDIPLPPCFAGFEKVLPAELLIAQEQYEPAREILAQLFAEQPDFPGRPSLARALEGCGQYREAAAYWSACGENATHSRRIFFLQRAGDAYRRGGVYDQAKSCYEQIRLLAQGQPVHIADAWIAQGLCDYAEGNSGDELACYHCALDALDIRDFVHQIRPLRYCAETEYRIRLFDQGAAHYAKALHYALGENDLRTAAQIESEWADSLREWARDLPAARQHYHNAIPLYHKALNHGDDVRSQLAMAFNGRGICAFHERNYKKQISDSTAAITILRQLQETPELLLQLSACLRNRGDSHDRLEKYEAARSDYMDAAQVYQKACAMSPILKDADELPELLLCCGRMCDRLDQYDASADYYTQVLDFLHRRTVPPSPSDSEYTALASLRRGYARMRNTNRNFTAALQDFRRAITVTKGCTQPNMLRIGASAWRQCGELYAAMEQYRLSADAFAQAEAADRMLQASTQQRR